MFPRAVGASDAPPAPRADLTARAPAACRSEASTAGVGAGGVGAGGGRRLDAPGPSRVGQAGEVGVTPLAISLEGRPQGPPGVGAVRLRQAGARDGQVVQPEPAGREQLEPQPGALEAADGQVAGLDGKAAAQSARAVRSVGLASGLPPASPSIQARTRASGRSAAEPGLDREGGPPGGANDSPATDAGSALASSRRLPRPECGRSGSTSAAFDPSPIAFHPLGASATRAGSGRPGRRPRARNPKLRPRPRPGRLPWRAATASPRGRRPGPPGPHGWPPDGGASPGQFAGAGGPDPDGRRAEGGQFQDQLPAPAGDRLGRQAQAPAQVIHGRVRAGRRGRPPARSG